MKTPVKWESFQPGCIVIRFDPERIKEWEVVRSIPQETVHELERMGFYGFMVLPIGISIECLNLRELTSLGLMPLPETKRKRKKRK